MTMRTKYSLTALCLSFGLVAQKTPTVDVTGPTIVAFFRACYGDESS